MSFFFAGKSELDIHPALETLNRELGVQRLLLEGGGVTRVARSIAQDSSWKQTASMLCPSGLSTNAA